MNASTWAVLIAGLLGCVGLVHRIRRRRHAVSAVETELASRPAALRDAELIHVERLFRISAPVRLAARIDRAYRLPSGVIVLVEFKTRWTNRPSRSDVIQLSAQRLAMERHGLLAPFGYVVINRPSRAAPYITYRVELMTGMDVVGLTHRREEILAQRIAPTHAANGGTCRTCAFRSECDRGRP